MSEQDGHRRQRCTHAVVLLMLSLLSLFSASAFAGEINACKYLIVGDFTSDPYGIAKELRAQARSKGFTVISAVNDVTPAERLKICVMTGSWNREAYGGNVAVRVLDASGALVNEAAASGTAWWSTSRTVRGVVSKIYAQLGYTGFNDEVYQQRVQREYPKRPTVALTEEEIRRKEPRSEVEGIWSDPQNEYRLGIVAVPEGSGDYVAVVLQSNSPLWQPTEIKAEIRSTASPDIFTCTYFMGDKKPAGTTLTLEHNSMLHGSVATPKGPYDLLLMRVWPKVSGESASTASANGVAYGTGFLLNRGGLLATNWHVVADAKNISVAFPGWRGAVSAEVVVRDVVNDLAVLRVTDSTKLATTCPALPFQLASSNGVTLGERVSAIGYPLTPMLGSNPKFSEGVVSSKSGWQDDPRSLQISAQVQPGSSGSPLFDSDGNIIGVVVATLDAGKVYQAASAIPQNVNFAIKADYLLSLAAMLPGGSLGSRTTAFSPEKASQCVAIIRAWY
jgi:S1-C subfamily serine protease